VLVKKTMAITALTTLKESRSKKKKRMKSAGNDKSVQCAAILFY